MRIGIDFDNTIAGYDHVFCAEAERTSLVPPGFQGTKRELQAALGEQDWMRLQGQVYGRLMQAAELLPGAEDFFGAARRAGHELFIVSHKTRHGHFDAARVDLCQAALVWMHVHGFFEGASACFKPENVSFHPTRAAKLERIGALGLDVFIDDLPAVLEDPAFPLGTRRCLYGRTQSSLESVESFADWEGVLGALLGAEPPLEHGFGVSAVAQAGAPGGGNNRLQCVQRWGQTYALKTFQFCSSDRRDRLGSERAALEFLGPHLGALVPQLIAANPAAGALLVEWIEGSAIESPGDAELDQLAEFLARLHALRLEADARSLPLASEACLSARELQLQLQARYARLAAVACIHPELERFLSAEFAPALDLRSSTAQRIYAGHGWDYEAPIALEQRSLSPSDFGFHNALRRQDGRLAFVDFEYFGWDDPVKLVADTLLHPAMQLGTQLAERFYRSVRETYALDESFAERLQALYGLYALRWCCILLNVFLPERQRRLSFAGARQGRAALAVQLESAGQLLLASEHTPDFLGRPRASS